MKRMITLMFLILPMVGYTQSKEVQDFTEKLEDLITKFQENILSEDKCEDISHDVDDYQDEIEKFLSDEEIDSDDAKNLRSLLKIADLFDDYFSCIGGWTSFPMPLSQFLKASDFFTGYHMAYISKDVYCADIIEYQFGAFVAYFVVNNTSNSYKVTYLFSEKEGTRSGEMGLPAGNIRMLFDNRDRPIPKYKIVKLVCERF